MASAAGAKKLKFLIKAPGKVILTGEHAVVYGRLALAASIDLTTKMHLTVTDSRDDDRLDIHLQDLRLHFSLAISDLPRPDPDAAQTLDTLKAHLGRRICHLDPPAQRSILAICLLYRSFNAGDCHQSFLHVDMHLQSDIPIGAGLGSSAAFSVVVSAAFHLIERLRSSPASDFQPDRDAVNRWAFRLEQMFHATPSGIDNSVCTRGGIVRFQDGRIDPLIAQSFEAPRILLVNTGIARETKKLVQAVREKWDRHKQVVEPILDAIDGISRRMADFPPDFDAVCELLSMNHWLLASLGVSHPKLDDICRMAVASGHACKLTGAGGGGLALVWIDPASSDDDVDKLKDRLSARGFTCCTTKLGVAGLDVVSQTLCPDV